MDGMEVGTIGRVVNDNADDGQRNARQSVIWKL